MTTSKSADSGLDPTSPDKKDIDVAGFAAPPLLLSLAEARGARKAGIRKCLDSLEKDGPTGFADDTMQKMANALATLHAAVMAIDASMDADSLAQSAQALSEFEVSDSEARRSVGFIEKLKGKQSPWVLLLERLETLSQSIDPFEDGQEHRWKELKAAYKRAHDLATKLADAVAAGRVRMARTVAEVKPAHEKLLKTLPEDRGEDAENALMALRGARDAVERQVHAIRGAHARSSVVLETARSLAGDYQELRRIRKLIDGRALPKWEETLADLIQTVTQEDPSGSQTDLDPLRNANKELAGLFDEAVAAGTALTQARQDAEANLTKTGA